MIGIGSESNTSAPLTRGPELPTYHRVFSKNLEEGNQAFRGWFDYEQFQLASGEFNSELLSLEACESVLGSFQYFAATYNQGELRADQIVIGLPALDSQYLWWGHAHGSSSTFEIPTLIPGETLHQKTQSGPPVLAVFIERSQLEAAAVAMGMGEHIDDVFRPNRTSPWLACCPEKTAHVRHELGEILRQGLAGSSELRADEVQSIILSEILELLDDRIHSRNPPSRADAALVERAGATFDADLELRSVSALALTLGVPRRTLYRAFKEVTGMGIHRFLTTRRLNRVFRELTEAAPSETSVTTIAQQHGFTEMGRFAGLYRQLFGECPKDTLRG